MLLFLLLNRIRALDYSYPMKISPYGNNSKTLGLDPLGKVIVTSDESKIRLEPVDSDRVRIKIDGFYICEFLGKLYKCKTKREEGLYSKFILKKEKDAYRILPGRNSFFKTMLNRIFGLKCLENEGSSCKMKRCRNSLSQSWSVTEIKDKKKEMEKKKEDKKNNLPKTPKKIVDPAKDTPDELENRGEKIGNEKEDELENTGPNLKAGIDAGIEAALNAGMGTGAAGMSAGASGAAGMGAGASGAAGMGAGASGAAGMGAGASGAAGMGAGAGGAAGMGAGAGGAAGDISASIKAGIGAGIAAALGASGSGMDAGIDAGVKAGIETALGLNGSGVKSDINGEAKIAGGMGLGLENISAGGDLKSDAEEAYKKQKMLEGGEIKPNESGLSDYAKMGSRLDDGQFETYKIGTPSGNEIVTKVDHSIIASINGDKNKVDAGQNGMSGMGDHNKAILNDAINPIFDKAGDSKNQMINIAGNGPNEKVTPDSDGKTPDIITYPNIKVGVINPSVTHNFNGKIIAFPEENETITSAAIESAQKGQSVFVPMVTKIKDENGVDQIDHPMALEVDTSSSNGLKAAEIAARIHEASSDPNKPIFAKKTIVHIIEDQKRPEDYIPSIVTNPSPEFREKINRIRLKIRSDIENEELQGGIKVKRSKDEDESSSKDKNGKKKEKDSKSSSESSSSSDEKEKEKKKGDSKNEDKKQDEVHFGNYIPQNYNVSDKFSKIPSLKPKTINKIDGNIKKPNGSEKGKKSIDYAKNLENNNIKRDNDFGESAQGNMKGSGQGNEGQSAQGSAESSGQGAGNLSAQGSAESSGQGVGNSSSQGSSELSGQGSAGSSAQGSSGLSGQGAGSSSSQGSSESSANTGSGAQGVITGVALQKNNDKNSGQVHVSGNISGGSSSGSETNSVNINYKNDNTSSVSVNQNNVNSNKDIQSKTSSEIYSKADNNNSSSNVGISISKHSNKICIDVNENNNNGSRSNNTNKNNNNGSGSKNPDCNSPNMAVHN